MDFVDIKKVRHYIYNSIEEMEQHYRDMRNEMPEILDNWRVAKIGDWVYSDDGRICQILRAGHLNKQYQESDWVGTAVGTFNCNFSKEMDTDFSKHKCRYMFSVNYSGANDSKAKRKNLSKLETQWIGHCLLGKNFDDAYNEVFKPEKTKNTNDKVVFLLKQERIRKALSESAKDVAKSLGLDHSWVLENLKLIAESSTSDKVKLEAVNNVGEIIGTKGEVKKESGQFLGAFQGFGSGDLDVAQRPKEAEFEVIDTPKEIEEKPE